MKSSGTNNFLKTLGPGILFASTCIGVSHLVQSTRAGATFGFTLIWAVVLANLFKYPFFEFASRYANATGKSIIDGYKKMGNIYLILYFLITVGTMFFVAAAVGYTTAGFLQNLFGIQFENMPLWTTAFLFMGSVLVLTLGKFKFLDSFIKVIGAVLLLSTIAAFVIALFQGPEGDMASTQAPSIKEATGFAFLIALMGWMPTAVDIASWSSLWTVERIKQTGYRPKLKETLLDFNLGYIISGILSVCFLIMGAYLMFGTSSKLPASPAGFANGVIDLYATNMGAWSYYIIAPAAFSIMLGTCIAVFDGYARAIEKCVALMFGTVEEDDTMGQKNDFYTLMVVILAAGAFGIIYTFSSDKDGFKSLIDFATTLSFLVAPVIAILNYRLVLSPYVDKAFEPKLWKKILAVAGIIFLSGFTLIFLLHKLGVF